MKKAYLNYLLSGIAALSMAACSEEDDNIHYPEYTHFDNPAWQAVGRPAADAAPTNWTVEFGGNIETPQWSALKATPAERPSWTAPDTYIYPASMTAVIRMSPYIEPDMDDTDILAAFIGGQCRGIGALRSGLWLLQIKAESAENRPVELRYYSTAKQELFVCKDAFGFEADQSAGSVDTPFLPTWDSQSDLPYYMDLQVKVDLGGFDNALVSGSDLVAAFAEDECRAVSEAIRQEDGSYLFNLRLFGRTATETFTLQYYTDQLKDIYTYPTTVGMEHATQKYLTLALQEHGYMDLHVALPTALHPYATELDQVSAYVNGQPCSITQAQDLTQYSLKMKASAGSAVSFAYYCDSLKHIFRSEACLSYTDAGTWGTEQAPQTLPLLTAEKLVTMQAVFTVTEYEAFNTTITEGDQLAAFVGDECRGVCAGRFNGEQLQFPMEIRGTLGVNETFTLKLYTHANRYLFNCPKSFAFEAGGQLGTDEEPQGIQLIVVDLYRETN